MVWEDAGRDSARIARFSMRRIELGDIMFAWFCYKRKRGVYMDFDGLYA